MDIESKAAKEEVNEILGIINQYNRKQATDPIKCLHAGNSIQLQFIGRLARLSSLKESAILSIPNALVPDHLLRKRYGIYLLLRNGFDHTFKSIRRARNLKGLFSMALGFEAVKFCYNVAKDLKSPLDEFELYQLMTDTIVQMNKNNYIRSLKILAALISTLKFIYPDNEKHFFFIDLLKKEQKILEKLYPKQEIKKYFNRYMPHIEKLLSEQNLWRVDDDFREVLLNQYPIIYCSTLDFVAPKISHHQEELSFADIKILFTTSTHVEKLKVKLKDLGLLETIEVHGFEHFLVDQEIKDLDQIRIDFEEGQSLAALMDAVQKKQDLLKESELVGKKLVHCIQYYLAQKNPENLLMAKWLLKNADQASLLEVASILNREVNFELLNNLHLKADIDKTYLTHLNLIDSNYTVRLQELAYLKNLCDLRQKVNDLTSLMDYKTDHQALEIHASIEPRSSLFAERERYLWEYLTRLQNFYALLIEDEKHHAEFKENINARLSFVKNKYLELLTEYQKQHLIDVLMMSELHRTIVLNVFKPTWYSKWFSRKKIF